MNVKFKTDAGVDIVVDLDKLAASMCPNSKPQVHLGSGYKDSNGNEIFEGDTLVVDTETGLCNHYVVYLAPMDTSSNGWHVRDTDGFYARPLPTLFARKHWNVYIKNTLPAESAAAKQS